MADEWTGINPSEVTTQLTQFADEMGTLARTYVDAFDLFNDELLKTWGSDNAVKFNTNLLALSEIKSTLYEVLNKIITAATNAAKFMAQSNGEVFDFLFGQVIVSTNYEPLKEEIDGVKGMNIPLAKLAVDTFDTTVKGIVEGLLKLPLAFGLYDPAQELFNQYKSMVTTAAGYLSDSVQEAVNWVKGMFENETMQVELGKTQAEEELDNSIFSGFDYLSDHPKMENVGDDFLVDWESFTTANDAAEMFGRFFENIEGVSRTISDYVPPLINSTIDIAIDFTNSAVLEAMEWLGGLLF